MRATNLYTAFLKYPKYSIKQRCSQYPIHNTEGLMHSVKAQFIKENSSRFG